MARREGDTLAADSVLPDVTVVVTAHNYAAYLPECLGSIDAQTARPAALVIVDDASTDDTPDVVARLGRELAVCGGAAFVRSEERLGPAGALNLAYAQASTDYVANVDADDLVEPDYLALLHRALTTRPDAALAYPRLSLFGAETGVYASHPWDPARLFFEGNYVPNSAMTRRAAVVAAGGYRDLATHLDWDLWLTLAEAGWTGVFVDEVLYHWRRHTAARTLQPMAVRLRTRADVMWRHRRLGWRLRGDALRWTAAGVRRRVRGRDRLSASGWLEPDRD
jgi:glycosyltransferase involved in cell wall biosynthesis